MNALFLLSEIGIWARVLLIVVLFCVIGLTIYQGWLAKTDQKNVEKFWIKRFYKCNGDRYLLEKKLKLLQNKIDNYENKKNETDQSDL